MSTVFGRLTLKQKSQMTKNELGRLYEALRAAGEKEKGCKFFLEHYKNSGQTNLILEHDCYQQEKDSVNGMSMFLFGYLACLGFNESEKRVKE